MKSIYIILIIFIYNNSYTMEQEITSILTLLSCNSMSDQTYNNPPIISHLSKEISDSIECFLEEAELEDDQQNLEEAFSSSSSEQSKSTKQKIVEKETSLLPNHEPKTVTSTLSSWDDMTEIEKKEEKTELSIWQDAQPAEDEIAYNKDDTQEFLNHIAKKQPINDQLSSAYHEVKYNVQQMFESLWTTK